MNQYSQAEVFGGTVAAIDAPEAARVEFIRKTYVHLAWAVLTFAALAGVLINSSFAPAMLEWLGTGRYNWLLLLGGFMGVGWVAERWARSGSSQAMQYLGLVLYVAAEAVIFTPLMFVAVEYSDPGVLPTAALLTAVVFVGLTAVVFVTRKDFSFLRGILFLGGFAALGLIVASVLFGFSLGTVFAAVMVVFAAGYILYYTSNILHHYPVGAHVAAALALFSAVALLFYYILMLLMRRD